MKEQPARDHIKLGEINNGESVDLKHNFCFSVSPSYDSLPYSQTYCST